MEKRERFITCNVICNGYRVVCIWCIKMPRSPRSLWFTAREDACWSFPSLRRRYDCGNLFNTLHLNYYSLFLFLDKKRKKKIYSVQGLCCAPVTDNCIFKEFYVIINNPWFFFLTNALWPKPTDRFTYHDNYVLNLVIILLSSLPRRYDCGNFFNTCYMMDNGYQEVSIWFNKWMWSPRRSYFTARENACWLFRLCEGSKNCGNLLINPDNAIPVHNSDYKCFGTLFANSIVIARTKLPFY